MRALTWQQWDSWWTRKGPPHLIALLRIAFGAYMMFYFLTYNPTVLFSNAGLITPLDWILPEQFRFILQPPDPHIAWVLYCAFLLSLLSFTLGFKTRTSVTIAFLFFVYYTCLSLHNYSTSYNRLFLFLTFLFTFSEAGNTYSFDMKKKKGSFFAAEPASVITQRLIAVQIAATYLGVGWQKMWLPDWQSGEILTSSFQGMWATPIAWWTVQQDFPMWFWDQMVFIVKAFEVALPLGLWSKKYRLWFMAGGVAFHVGITLFLAAIWWFYAMIACYICYFEPEEVHQRLKQYDIRT